MTTTGLVPRLRAGASVLVLGGVAALSLAGPAIRAAAAPASTPVPVLVALSASHQRDYDEVVFTFSGALPRHYTARYVSRLPGGPELSSGRRSRLLVTFSRATGKNGRGLSAYGPASRSYALPGVMQVATVADHRKSVSFEVGLARHERFHLSALPRDRVAMEVRTPYQTAGVRDYFADSRSVFGAVATQPVSRPVIRPATESSALQRLFAGPTQAERARGLRFVTSGATGFRQLRIHHGVARVQLTGGCNSGGSAITVATEIMPTLRQFPSVRWVKIYDPSGRTGQSGGHADSIPACLKPSAAKLLTAQLGGPALTIFIILAGPGLLLGLVLSVLSVVAGLALRPNVISPTAYRAERMKDHPVQPGEFWPDLAWPFYPLRQAWADLARIEAERRARYRKLWKWPGRPLVWILLLPLSVVALTCLLIAGLTTIVLAVLFALVTLICAGASVAVFTATVLLLRGAESSWHKLKRAEASCPHCYQVMPRPAYRCPGCSKLHRDLRPGRLGLFARRCDCGTLLPTMVLRAAWRLSAVCQKCAKPLRAGSGTLRDVRIPIFGDTSAGKTRFLYSGLDSLVDTTRRAQIPLGFPDEESENQATVALDLIRSGRDTVKTSFGLPTALTCQLGKGADRTLLHLFDAAGEVYQGTQMQDSLGFLDHGNGLVYVLDPFSIGSVRDQLAGQNATAIRLAHAAAGDPETAYGEVVSRLRDNGVAATGQRLAIVISKADLLALGGLDLPEESGAIADWLMRGGVHNLVLSARRDFAEARYFAVASLAATGSSRSYDPGAPLRWLLASRGLRLPEDPDTAHPARVPGSPVNGDQGSSAKAQL
jgi:Double-GTPase 2